MVLGGEGRDSGRGRHGHVSGRPHSGVKHLKELCACLREGYRAGILFVIQMKGVSRFIPNDRTHPEFGEALRAAAAAGVLHTTALSPQTRSLDAPVPVFLNSPYDTPAALSGRLVRARFEELADMPGSLFEVINKNPVVVKSGSRPPPGLLAVSRNSERPHGEIRQQNWGKGQDILQIQGRFTQRHHRTDELGIVYPAALYLLQHSLQHLLLPPRPSGRRRPAHGSGCRPRSGFH